MARQREEGSRFSWVAPVALLVALASLSLHWVDTFHQWFDDSYGVRVSNLNFRAYGPATAPDAFFSELEFSNSGNQDVAVRGVTLTVPKQGKSGWIEILGTDFDTASGRPHFTLKPGEKAVKLYTFQWGSSSMSESLGIPDLGIETIYSRLVVSVVGPSGRDHDMFVDGLGITFKDGLIFGSGFGPRVVEYTGEAEADADWPPEGSLNRSKRPN